MSDDLAGLLVHTARQLVERTRRDAVPVTIVQATVTAITGSLCTLKVDGDTAGVLVQAECLTKLPAVSGRVLVQFVPPHAAYVVGWVGGFVDPPPP